MAAKPEKDGADRRILFCGDPGNGVVHTRTFAGAARYAAAAGWTILAEPEARPDPGTVRRIVARHRPAGCILVCSDARYDIPPRLFGRVPVVRLDPSPDGAAGRNNAGVVEIDNEAVVRLAFEELRALLPPQYAIIASTTMAWWSVLRARLFRERVEASGKPCHEFPVWPREHELKRDARMKDWIAALPRGTAVFAVTDRLATIAADAARELRIRVPHDLTILGVDDRDDLRRDDLVPISSIKIDFERCGFLAARMLGENISHKGAKAQSGNPAQSPQTQQGGPGAAAIPASPRGKKSFTVGPLMVVRRASTRGRGRRASWIPAAVDAIRREASGGLTSAALAQRFPCSRNLFERRFREAMGHSVLDEILHVRLENVLALLSRPDFPIGAISDFCGFGCDSELRKLFRKRMGVSMRRWRAENVL